MTFGQRIKRLRNENKQSMDELVSAFKVKYNVSFSKSMMSRWENDIVDPGIKIANIYADYFQVSLNYLIKGQPDSVVNIKSDDSTIQTIAAHLEGKEITKEKIDDVLKYIDFIFRDDK